uniref:cGMP-dependent protein kinase interacting domain-containing protein n=1 Tax=Strongyloides stercoralis TaxID=6248 RepID=A0A0K0ES70_STRER
MSASTAIPITTVPTSSSINVFQSENNINLPKRWKDKRAPLHHYHQHVRASHRSCDKRKLREKRRSFISTNVISTDGTTSGDDGENVVFEIQNPIQIPIKNHSFLNARRRENLTSDLEADCEDNNSTDADALSQTGSFREITSKIIFDDKNKIVKKITTDEVPNNEEFVNPLNNIQILNEKIKDLELQLESVLKHNIMLKEENEILKKRKHKS